MTLLKTTIAAAALSAALAAPAQAEAISLGAVPGADVWMLFANPERRLCGASVVYSPGEIVLIVASAGGFTLGLVNSQWRLQAGASYDVVVRTDTNRWSLRPIARGHNMLESGALRPEAASDLSRTDALRIENSRGEVIGSYSMAGSTKAMRAAGACAERLIAADGSTPFGEPVPAPGQPLVTPAPSPPAPTSADPFGPPMKLAM